MDNLLSPSAKKRLPVAIQKLSEKEQVVFVMLRMRRDEAFIARELEISLAEAHEMTRTVQNTLIKSGALDLIQNPVFFPIDHPYKDDDETSRPIQLAGAEMDIADQVALERFYKILEESLNEMPKNDLRLLGLWFNKEMKAKEILNLYNNLGLPISSKKSINETREQDVFYELEKNIRKLLNFVRSNMDIGDHDLTPSRLKAILEETGV